MRKDKLMAWDQAQQYLQKLLSKDIYENWISVVHCRELTDDTAVLAVANDFYHSWLEEHYLPLIRQALASVTGRELNISLVVDYALATIKTETKEKVRPPRPPGGSAARKPNLNQNYTFDSFVVGPSNQFAHAASIATAQSPAKAYNPLFIYGGVGLGKTHLMQAIGQFAASKNSKAKVAYLTSEAFTNEYIEALQTSSLPKFRKKYRTVDLLLIDDIHFLAGKERMQEEFFHTFNAIFENNKQIVMTSDRPASDLAGLAPRLVSRFEWGLVTELETPDVETRVAILRKKCVEKNISISTDLLFYLAERISSNIRRLEGALIRVASFISLTGQEIDKQKLEYLLRDALDEEKQLSISVEAIQKTVADHYKIHVSDIIGKTRPQNIAWPRQIAMYLSRDMTAQSFPVLGKAFGRNHATILHACNLVSRKQEEDSGLRHTLALLRQRIGKNNAAV